MPSAFSFKISDVYKRQVQYSLDGHDWMDIKTVIVKAPTVTPPAPSGGGSNASVGRPSVREDAGQSQAAAERTHFIDVPRDSWYYSSVYRAHENGLIDGVGGRRFDPDSTCLLYTSTARRSSMWTESRSPM